jgi:hypothetical protein
VAFCDLLALYCFTSIVLPLPVLPIFVAIPPTLPVLRAFVLLLILPATFVVIELTMPLMPATRTQRE